MIYNPSLKQIENKEGLWLEWYSEPKPNSLKTDFWSDESGHFRKDTYSAVFTRWQQSVILTPIHPSQEEAFKELACNFHGMELFDKESNYDSIKIPPDNIEIREISDKGIKEGVLQFTKYAFLKTEQKEVIADFIDSSTYENPEPTKEESRDQILLNECLEAITKLRPSNPGLGVLQHKLKVRLNKF